MSPAERNVAAMRVLVSRTVEYARQTREHSAATADILARMTGTTTTDKEK